MRAYSDDVLVIITTDHGNANPGLDGASGANESFDVMVPSAGVEVARS